MILSAEVLPLPGKRRHARRVIAVGAQKVLRSVLQLREVIGRFPKNRSRRVVADIRVAADGTIEGAVQLLQPC